MGDALHEHMDTRAKYGVGEAMLLCDQIAKRHELTPRETSIFLARCKHFEWSPPRGSFGEVALVLLEDGTVERMIGGKGSYTWPANAVTGGTLDLMWSEPEPLDLSDPEHPRCPPGSVLWVPDVKSGEETYVEPVEHNFQILTNALLAARWTGARRVAPGVLFWRKGMGEWDLPLTDDGKLLPWGEADMRRHERQVRADMDNVREQQRKALAGEPLDMVDGPWCEWCPARARCSVHTAQLKMLATGEMAKVGDAPLTEQERTWVADRLGAFERVGKALRDVLRADVEASGRAIIMSNGNVWGPYDKPTKSILVEQALPILQEELGEHAAEVVQRSISKESIEDVVRAMHQEQGVKKQLGSTVRRIFAKFGEAGALLEEPKTVFGAHKPRVDTVVHDPNIEDLDE
jgi:hypothetical protein